MNTKHINQLITRLDKDRSSFLKQKNHQAFIKTYSKSFDVKNLNKASHWNELFKNNSTFQNQSPMTKDKIKILARLIPRSKFKILDLGIGQGFVEELLQKRNIDYYFYGIDISSVAIMRAKKMFKGNFIRDDVLKIGSYFQKCSFDYILAIELMEHISPSMLFAFYQQINNLLKKRGLFVLSIPINENLQQMNSNPSAHVRDYSFEIINAELNLNGFEILDFKYLYAFAKNYSLKKLIAKILPMRWKPNSLIIVARKK